VQFSGKLSGRQEKKFRRPEPKMKNRKTEILIETHEQILIRAVPGELLAFCPACGAETLFVAPERAILATGLTMREIFRLLEGGVLHFIETETGAAFFCSDALSMKAGIIALESSQNLLSGEKL
jgi:hypothetical protein